ncbi:hypothetical protein ACFLX5_04560 [Chloroflexota bacterium]
MKRLKPNLSRCIICGDLCGVANYKLWNLETGQLHKCALPEAEQLQRRAISTLKQRNRHGHTLDRHALFGPGHTARVYHDARRKRWQKILEGDYRGIYDY